ncbi:MAG: hypothetical protein M0Z80_00105 [Treponema sp.]|nr:hypothetical protein [Treponema sp.]
MVRTRRLPAWIAVALAAASLGAVQAQVEPGGMPAGKGPGSGAAASETRLPVLLQVSGPKNLDLWRYGETLSAAIMRSHRVLSVHRAYNADPTRLDNLARYEGAPVVIALKLSEDGDRVSVRWDISAVEGIAKGGATPIEGSFIKPAPSEDELSSSFWVETTDALDAFLAGLRVARIRITGLPGSVVEGFGEPFLMPDSGSLLFPVIVPERITWAASAPGRYPERGLFYAAKDGETLVIPRRQWSIDFGAYGLAFPELRVAFEPGAHFFARATLSQFALGWSLQSPNNGVEQPLTLSFPFVQVGVGIGSYFAPPSRELRTYIATDLFARLFDPEGRGLYLDPVAPIGLQPAFGLEWGRGPAVRLYAEMSGVFYPWAWPGLMLASLGGEKPSSLVFGGGGWLAGQPGWFLEIPIFRMGLRLRL